MLQPKFIQALILLLFISVVIISIFFLLSRQLTPIMGEIVGTTAATRRVSTGTSVPHATPTATLVALTLDMLATTQPTALPTAETPLLPSTAAFLADPSARFGIVTSDSVNIRSYPSLAGEVVGQAKQGDRLEIILISNDGQWVQVCCPLGTNGGYQQNWVAAEFIAIQEHTGLTSAAGATTNNTSPRPSASGNTNDNITRPESDAPIGTVNSTLVNVRSGPGTNYAVVGQVSGQTQVAITGRNEAGTWWQICCPSGVPANSWISADLTDLSTAKEQVMTQVSIVPAPATATISTTNRTN